MQKSLRILFIINPIAGGKEKRDWETAIREFFRESDYAFEFFLQSGQDDQASTRLHIERFKPDTVVAIGGDGTVKMVAELLRDTPIKMGIIPAGSANGLAKELGIPTDINGAIEVIMNNHSRQIDAILINNKELCFHLSDAGMNALLVKYFEASKKRGLWGYGKSLLKMFWNKRKMQVTISTDEGKITRGAYMVVLANAEKYGTGAVINPNGSVSDGKFEVVVVRKLHVVEIFKAVTARKTFSPKRIEVFHTKKVVLQFRRRAHFQVDGEYQGKITSLEAHILPGVVKVLLPQENG